MSEQLAVYEQAITTHRRAEVMARVHGFGNIARLAHSLPDSATVLDVGAGASPFGKDVALLRPDIRWVNLDYSYNDPAIYTEVTQDSPSNVDHVAGDATMLEEIYGDEKYDAVFSYWLFSHLSLESLEPAVAAARGIFKVTKTNGIMSVGPRTDSRLKVPLVASKSYRTKKDPALEEDRFVEDVTQKTQLHGSARYVQKLTNQVATPFFGTTRYARSDGRRIPLVYSPVSQEYVYLASPNGARTMGKLAFSAARYAARNHQALKAKR